MKNLFTLICLIALAITSNAQVHQFTYDTAPKNPTGIDTVYGTVPSSIPTIPDGQWHSWDLSNVLLAGYKYYAEFSTASGFTNATHSNKAYVEVAPSVKYETNLMFAIKNDGIKTYGERLTRQAFPLVAQTGDPGDSLVILPQDVTYSEPQVQMPFPCSMDTAWSSISKSTTNLSVTIASLFLNNAPAERRSINTSSSEVIGWGILNIRRLDNKPSGSKPVLLVKTTINIVDSLYINGAPAPASLLALAGLQQGQTTTVYQKSFYRQYEMLPMCNITYTNATFTTIKDVNMHAQRLPYPDDVADVELSIVAEVYPNPSSGEFTIKVGDIAGKNVSYSITDMAGRMVKNANISNGETVVNLSTGNYVLTIMEEGKAVSGQKIVVQ